MNSLLFYPVIIFLIGVAVLPFLTGRLKKVFMVLVPALAFIQVLKLVPGEFGHISYLDFDLVLFKVDKLPLVFANVFTLMALIGTIYSLHVKEDGHHIAAFLYVAGSLGVTFAGDYLTLFIFWELMAVSSVFLIWYRRRKSSINAGFRYLLVHTAGGLVLLAGIFLKYQATKSMAFGPISPEGAGLAEYLIMTGFILNAAVPPIHAWLPDAYPEATVTGAVFMCAFTTKTAVYVLARAFPGFEILMILGAIMTLYGVAYAVIENDARRILAYHIVSQVGYMVCGVGIGTAMAVNGACAHAYAHIIYKALLFMGVGAVLEMTGKSKLNELGGLYKYMPMAMIFTVIGGISISGFPLTSGFVSKSMIIAAAGEHHQLIIMLMLTLASVGTFLSVGIKLPYFIWFGKDSGVKADDPPLNMIVGMSIAAFLCFFIGVYPQMLYDILPYPVHYHPYSGYHIAETIQLMAFTGLGFYLFVKKLQPEPKSNLDLDWFYRKGALLFMWVARKPVSFINDVIGEAYQTVGLRFIMLKAASFFSGFDRWGIDGVVDGMAATVIKTGDRTRNLQTGKLQHYVGFAVFILFIIIGVVVLV
ncbi:MAG: Na(+)/H(+) antiporter subunit D [Desulfosarcina sp.]|nr:Na(+)/H(+) antiporter subunit D [Desulfobacterales bacterium]